MGELTLPVSAMPVRRYKITIAAVAMVVLLLALFVWLVFVPRDRNSATTIEVRIETGSNLSNVARILKNTGVIRSGYVFYFYVRLVGDATELKAGRYILSPAMSVPQIARILTAGLAESEDKEVTIPEGSNIWEVEKIFIQSGLIMRSGEVVRRWRDQEGYLFPDTYRFDPKHDTVADVIEKMQENFWQKAGRPEEKIVIIASLLEKEAKTKEDMELVSGIVKKRLNNEVLLQIDAAVAYGVCLREAAVKNYSLSCDVTQVGLAKEIKVDQPYNTYMWPGLPPGPISNPGLIALNAAANPKNSEYWYYLSTRDGSQIIYSKTAQEHLMNRKKYLGF